MKPKEPPQEPDILYQKDIKKLTLENAKQILPPEHLKVFEKMMKQVYAEGFLNGQKSITTAVFVLFFTLLSFGQNSIVTAGNETETIGETFPIMQQVDTIINEVSLGVPTFELPEQPKQQPIIKKKSFLQKLIEAIIKIFKK